MTNRFVRYARFGSVSDEKTRIKLADYTFNKVQNISCKDLSLSDANTDNFASQIDEIISNPDLKEICEKDSELAEKITQDILDFTNRTKKIIDKTENPFEKEAFLLGEFEKSKKEGFNEKWKLLKQSLEKIYTRPELDLDFYETELRSSIDETIKSNPKKLNFESVKEHFTDKWKDLLLKKEIKWEMDIIDKHRKLFCKELYKRIEELKKLKEVLEPFTNELGRLWDMSKGHWHKVDFDILKKYADLLKKDKALIELAEMLGRMRQAEKEFEEELFTEIVFKNDWKIEHASKSDLIGVHESDDLNNILPSETALLTDKTLQEVFLKKYAEKKLQTFEYESRMLSYKEEENQNKRLKEKEEIKGPFIICVDTSGSMHGVPEIVAKTLCFALLKIAIRDKRRCYLISFSTSIQTLDLTDLQNSLDKIIDFLSMSFYGGTDATPAMNEALKMLETKDFKKADIIMVSDFVMPSFNKSTQGEIDKAKKNKTKFHSLVIGNSPNENSIKDFDSNWFYDTTNEESVLTLVKNLNEF